MLVKENIVNTKEDKCLKALEERQKELFKQSREINLEIENIGDKLKSLRLDKLLSSDLLSKVKWRYYYNLSIVGREKECPEICSIMKPNGYHDCIKKDDFSFYFDDYEYRIIFKDAEVMCNFIKKYNLTVSFDSILSELKDTKESYEKTKELANSLGLAND